LKTSLQNSDGFMLSVQPFQELLELSIFPYDLGSISEIPFLIRVYFRIEAIEFILDALQSHHATCQTDVERTANVRGQ
jgi:hypothetical protein